MKLTKTSGATIAAAAAAFILSGTIMTPVSAQMSDAKVQCFGVNSCKGQGACKTAKNDCKGLNSCKGQGFVSLTASDCKTKGGTTKS